MNKKLLSLAVAAGVASSGAQAVDLTLASPVPDYIASEFTVASTGTTINAGTTALVDAGFSVDDSNKRYLRFDISGGAWVEQLAAVALAVNDSSGAGGAVETYSAGGATTDSYVIFGVLASTGNNVVASDDVVFTPTNGIVVTDQAGVSITYQMFETAAAAVANSGSALASDTGAIISFTAGNTTSADTVSPSAIDVTVSTGTGAVFVGGNANIIGQVNTVDSALAPTDDTGTAANTANMEASSTLTVTGDFTFAQDLTAGAPDGTYSVANVFLDDGNPNCDSSDQAATAVNDTTATFNTSAFEAGTFAVCVNANGVSLIAEQTFTGSYTSVAATGYGAETTALTLGTLAKNGASASQSLVLTPGGAFSNYLRVTNTSNISGNVTFSLTNDAGTSVSGVTLGSISGQSSTTLAGQSSTGLININDLYAAAQAADSTFAHNSGKLRVTVNANFSSVEMQNITLATDNTSFSTF